MTEEKKEAQYYLPLKSDKNVATLFYKWINIKYNDGTNKDVLHYLSTCGGGWMLSYEEWHGGDPQKFVKERLIEIVNEVTS